MSASQSPVPPTRDDDLPLLNARAESRIDGESVERRFLVVDQNEESFRPAPMLAALAGIFWAVAGFYADPVQRDQGALDEDQRRDCRGAALASRTHVLSPA